MQLMTDGLDLFSGIFRFLQKRLNLLIHLCFSHLKLSKFLIQPVQLTGQQLSLQAVFHPCQADHFLFLIYPLCNQPCFLILIIIDLAGKLLIDNPFLFFSDLLQLFLHSCDFFIQPTVSACNAFT